MLQASAALANCIVGIEISSGPNSFDARRCDPQGRWSPPSESVPSSSKEVVIDDVTVGSVWIERPGPALPLDDMLVDRMALTAAVILQHRRVLTDEEHTLDLLFPSDELAVLTACAALKVAPSTPVRVVAYTGGGGARLPVSGDLSPGRSTEVEADGDRLRLVPASFVPPAEFVDTVLSRSVKVGISLAAEAADAHLVVGTARFARGHAYGPQPLGSADDLGALNLLAPENHLPHRLIPDIVRANELRDSPQGVELLSTLRLYLRASTLRAAAQQMHLHHSTVAYRLAKLSDHVGFTVDALENRARATAMVMIAGGDVGEGSGASG